MIVFCYFYDAERLFYLPIHNPELTLFLLVAYPFISALPQEFIFCSFFFKRYQPLFGNGSRMVWLSAIVFAYAHVLYINPVAPSLGLLGGLIFANTFRKHKSLALVTLEHALYGNALFVIGLGWYFYAGSMQVS
jgi:membrane protease YdiL (CAAX protease family)